MRCKTLCSWEQQENAALVSELEERALAADYTEYFRKKVVQLANTWGEGIHSGPYRVEFFDPRGKTGCLRKKATSKKSKKRRDDVDYPVLKVGQL
jgi:hypothetical protein